MRPWLGCERGLVAGEGLPERLVLAETKILETTGPLEMTEESAWSSDRISY